MPDDPDTANGRPIKYVGIITYCADSETPEAILGHEFQHFVDWCTKSPDKTQEETCGGALCAELRAYKAETGCTNASDCWDKGLGNYWEKYRKPGELCETLAKLSDVDIQKKLDDVCNNGGILPPPTPFHL